MEADIVPASAPIHGTPARGDTCTRSADHDECHIGVGEESVGIGVLAGDLEPAREPLPGADVDVGEATPVTPGFRVIAGRWSSSAARPQPMTPIPSG